MSDQNFSEQDAPVTRRPRVLDLFCGAGGLSLGFEQAGFDVVGAVDIDPVHLAVHEYNFPETAVACIDLSSAPSSALIELVERGAGESAVSLDCIVGGPSCQGFSDMGAQDPDDPRNQLVFAFARAVEELQPKCFVMENVPGLLFKRSKPLLGRLLDQFADAGYELAHDSPLLLNAASHGVPQARRRAFIIGTRDGRSVALPDLAPSVTVEDAIGDLRVLESMMSSSSHELCLDSATRACLDQLQSDYVTELNSQGRFGRPSWDGTQLSGMALTNHTPATVAKMSAVKHGESFAPGRTKRLSPSSQSPTLRAGTGLDHGSHTAPRPLNPWVNRAITVREAARLHSFPDWFEFHRTKWHALRQIGNSVPPRLASAVAATLHGDATAGQSGAISRHVPSSNLLKYTLSEAADRYLVPRSALPSDVRRDTTRRSLEIEEQK